jgi:hypothetical protein
MGSMSASDAAPLPRLGEVFFDVRGNSRSMRLSWYADTGVAVFSIWQGGTCTGTFRLPIDDLTRMVEALRRGPQGPRARRDASRGQVSGDQAYGRDPAPGRGTGPGASLGDGPDPGPSTVAMRPPSAPGSRTDPGYLGEAAAYHDDAAGYADEPGGYPGESAGYQDDAGGYGSDPGGYPAQVPLHGYSGDRPAGDYPGGYPDDPATGDYRSAAAASYRDDPLTGDYRGAPDYRDDQAGYRDEPAGYQDDPAGYRDEPAGYRDDSSGYRDEPAGYHDDPPGYPAASPLRGYSGAPAAADYRGGPVGDYRDNAADGYSDEPSGYPAEPLPPVYPGEPSFRDYGHESAIGDYPGESPEHDLESSPGGGGYAPPGREWEDTDVGPIGDYSEDPSPESFPYGRPPGKRRQRERGRYPGRH